MHVASWQAAYREIIPAEVIESWPLDRRITQWTSLLEAAGTEGTIFILVAVADAEVIGFVSSRASEDSDGEDVCEVSATYVAPEVQRRGAGHALLAAACDALQAAGFDQATLWVLAHNTAARAFYEREGWKPDGASQPLGDTGILELRYCKRLARAP